MSLPQLDYWRVQNTGWSAGTTWFDVGGSRASPARFASESEARGYVERNRWADASMKWRLVHVQLEVFENKRITTEEWFEVAP